MATIVQFSHYEFDENGKKTCVFRTLKEGEHLYVKSFENGVATVDMWCDIESFAKIVAGCFDRTSNFPSIVINFYYNECGCKAFTGIQFKFNGINLLVTKENANKDKICDAYIAGLKAEGEKYRKSPEYRADRAKKLKLASRREMVRKDFIAVDESTELCFKDKEAESNWKQWVRTNSKSKRGKATVTYARRWAKYMQYLMGKYNKTVHEIAEQASYVSDIEHIFGSTYAHAVRMLVQCWKYGEELRKWHNESWGCKDTNCVVNPSELTIIVG